MQHNGAIHKPYENNNRLQHTTAGDLVMGQVWDACFLLIPVSEAECSSLMDIKPYTFKVCI